MWPTEQVEFETPDVNYAIIAFSVGSYGTAAT